MLRPLPCVRSQPGMASAGRPGPAGGGDNFGDRACPAVLGRSIKSRWSRAGASSGVARAGALAVSSSPASSAMVMPPTVRVEISRLGVPVIPESMMAPDQVEAEQAA